MVKNWKPLIKKNPQLICCATVDAIKDQQIHVAFDGWQGAFDYWVRYDSRDIFPVGWCTRSLHPVQPPKPQRNRIDPNTNKRKSMKPSNTFIPDLDNAVTTATLKPTTLPPQPVIIYFNWMCQVGPYLNRHSCSMLSAPNYKTLSKQILKQILNNCSNIKKLAQRLYALRGEDYIVVVASKNLKVKIPSANRINDVEFVEFLKTVCKVCEACPNLITIQSRLENCDSCCKQHEKADNVIYTETTEQVDEMYNKNINKSDTLQTNDGIFGMKQEYKRRRRRQSDIDIESSSTPSPTSSSGSNSNSSLSESFTKIPKKTDSESIVDSTSQNTYTQTNITPSGK